MGVIVKTGQVGFRAKSGEYIGLDGLAVGSMQPSVEVDATLTETGKAADAKAVGDKLTTFNNRISNLEERPLSGEDAIAREGVSRLSESIAETKEDLASLYTAQYTRNLVDSDILLGITGCTKNGDEYSFVAKNAKTFGALFSDFEDNTYYIVSFYAKTENNTGTSGNGLGIKFNYTDGKNNTLSVPNSTSEWTKFELFTDGRSIIDIVFIYGNGGNNIWHIKNLQLEKGRIATEYVPYSYKTAKDEIARSETAEIQSTLDRIIDASIWYAESNNREKELRNQFLNGSEPAHWYGVQWAEEDNADNVIAINSDGDSGLHNTLPIQNKMRRCVCADGIVQYYLSETDSELKVDGSPAKLDGTDGNVMVEIPEFFYRCEESIENGIRKIMLKISEQGIPGFRFSRKRYTSAYEATVDRDTNKLASVCTTIFSRRNQEVKSEGSENYIVGDSYSHGLQETAERNGFTANAARYRGGTNDSSLDNETNPTGINYARNQLGIPISNVNRKQCRAYADPKNNLFMDLYDTQKTIWILMQTEFKTRNIQKSIESGGLGLGATKYPNYNAYEAFFSPQGGIACLPCGITNKLGNRSGEVYYKMKNVPVASTGSKESINYTRFADLWMPVMSYRGIENQYGHLYSIIDQLSIKAMRTFEYMEGHENDPYFEYYNVTYYYEKNPFMTTDDEKESLRLGTFKFMSNTRYISSLLLGKDAHIMHTETSDKSRAYNYCDASELLSGYGFPTMNGRIVSNNLVGMHFMVSGGHMEDAYTRPSDGTRINMF